jgi:hypothetical protein
LDLRGVCAALADSPRAIRPVNPSKPYRQCVVSFTERGGVFPQKAHVEAQTAFEACALAVKYWRSCHYVKGPSKHAALEVEINVPARKLVAVRMSVLLDWLYKRPPKNPEEAARIKRLCDLLADDRR